MAESGPPYMPKIANVGGVPTLGVDVPISSVFIFLFLLGAVGHMTVLQINMRKGHKFIMSGLMFGFCMARIVTMIMRIVWAVYPTDVQVAIAASIFVSAGVLLLFIINLIFAQRIIRATHPHFGWHRALHWVFVALYALILAMLAMVITATVQSYYTLDMSIRSIDRNMQLAAGTYFMFFSFLPIPMVLIGLVVPRKTRVEKFGSGRWRTKIAILLSSAVLLTLGASFRVGTSFKAPRPRDDPAWYHAKWCFYFFNFIIEISVVYLYLVLRVDRRFHIPNGSKGPGDYVDENNKDSRADTGNNGEESRPSTSSATLILSDEEVFDDASPVELEKSKEYGSPV